MSEALEAVDLEKSYLTRAAEIPVLRGVNLRVSAGEFLAVVGASGVGKSTLLNLLGLLDAPTRGEVRLGGRNLAGLRAREKDALRTTTFGFVFQLYHLLPEFTAVENVLLPALVRWGPIRWWQERRRARRRAEQLLERVGLLARMHHRPDELSGGEQQRVAIARALVNEPQFLLCDEPTGNLDEHTAERVMELLVRLHRESGQTIVMVTHDLHLAACGDRVAHLSEGRIDRVVSVKEHGESELRQRLGLPEAPRPAAPSGASTAGATSPARAGSRDERVEGLPEGGREGGGTAGRSDG
jgi:lipoprotein-releasing system ATP-binding protein